MPARPVNPLTPRGPVSRVAYLAWGFGLAVPKYVAEAAFVAATTDDSLWPTDFLSPSLDRLALFAPLGDWAGPAYLAWTLPFSYVAAVMSVRRASTAGISPWLGLLVLAPVVNLPMIVLLAALPPRTAAIASAATGPPAIAPPPEPDPIDRADRRRAAVWKAAGVLFGPTYTLAMVGACVYLLGNYGGALFFLTPVLVGAVAGFCANAVVRCGYAETQGWVMLATLASYAALLALAFEGLICLLMALPLALPLALLGGSIGRGIAAAAGVAVTLDGRGAAACLLLAPVGGAVAPADRAPVRPVVTAVVVDAPPAAVWERVLAFPPLPEPTAWYFRKGLAYPIGAAIDGAGVGAVRRCRFSTGAFVEPITAWEPGRRLAFDVTAQPPPMVEWHPWADVSPPHLHGTFESVRGEFRLEPLPGGRTRLTGTTWCRVKMGPHGYWAAWTDAILHRIHRRVLGHVGRLAEADAAADRQKSRQNATARGASRGRAT